jgi:transposase
MNPPTSSIAYARFIAVDLHKHYVVVGGVNAQQHVVLPLRRMDLRAWPAWARQHLRPSDTLVVEATTNAWDFYDAVQPLVGRAVVANAGKVKLIAAARVKTDKLDVLVLAKLLAAGWMPEVWVPPVAVRELRGLVAHRRQLVTQRTRLKNHLHSLLHRHQLTVVDGDPFADKHRAWWEALQVSPVERLHLRHDLKSLLEVEAQIAEVETELQRLSTSAPWAEQVPYLIHLPGFGLLTSMTLLAAIGDVTRFECAKQLVGYAGLGASVHDSGQTHRTGRITKSGRRDMRWALVEAAWAAVASCPYWQARYARLARRMHPNQAIVAIAHHLLIAVWHVLTEQVADRQADPQRVASKLMRWSWALTDEQRGGLTTRQFVRYHLMRLQLGDDLTHLTYGNMPRRIASVEEVLTLKPELRSRRVESGRRAG